MFLQKALQGLPIYAQNGTFFQKRYPIFVTDVMLSLMEDFNVRIGDANSSLSLI